ncbi:hypothetical protein [Burkholderia multivorans]|uniref:hypothetical protein n=1 Tax=Burkholderia multivorans TaxID=87883 RepID=UPI003D64DF71
MTVNEHDWSGVDAMRRFWKGALAAAPQPAQADAPVRTEALRKGLFEARDAMRVMSNWVKEIDPAGYSWGIHMVHRANAVLNGGADTAQADAPAEAREPHSDDVAVDSFAAAMKHKLALARAKGRGGWETCSPADLSRMLREHVEKGDPRDVANFCMMLWHHGSPIVSAPADARVAQAGARVGLTDEQIDEIARPFAGLGGIEDYRAFARALLAAHPGQLVADDAAVRGGERAKRKAFTAVFLDVTTDEASEIVNHPKWSAGSWSHALDDRDAARAELARATSSQAHPGQPEPRTEVTDTEPQWIVNDLGELGVKVGGRFFFLYKGDNIEYGASSSRDGIALHDDGSPMQYRIVGKREFGETCLPVKWVLQGRSEDRYHEKLVYHPGLSFGKPEDGDWKLLPAARAQGGES